MYELERKQMIDRIRRMELLYDRLCDAVQHTPTLVDQDPDLIQTQQQLVQYYNSGAWLHDYNADEQGLLPQHLKRGVLSQDGLYNLLCERSSGKP